MRVNVTHGIDDLANDLAAIPVKAAKSLAGTVRKNAVEGNRTAARFAKESAGKHGKHYHRAFEAEAITPLSWEYGPLADRPQGGMSFEFGSRNQRPHLDLARSLDIIGPQLQKDVSDDIDGLFW